MQIRLASVALSIALATPAPAQAPAPALDEVFYHIFVRSLHDSDGDRIGDLRGIEQKLGYLHSLGVTSILLTPINPSPFSTWTSRESSRTCSPTSGRRSSRRLAP